MSGPESPLYVVEYTCQRCGRACRKELSKPGFLPRYCDDCVPLLNAERVKRWRSRHPDQARAAAKKQNDKRARKDPAARHDVNDAALASKVIDHDRPSGLTADEWQTLRRAASYIVENGGACDLFGLVKSRSTDGVVMAFPNRSTIHSLVKKEYLTRVKDLHFKSSTNPQGVAEALTNKASAALGLPVAVEPGSRTTFDYWMRDALRQAAERQTIRRDRRTKRGVEALVKLGLLQVVRQTDTNTTYEITALGSQVFPQLPTADEEWAASGTNKYGDFSVVIPSIAQAGPAPAQPNTAPAEPTKQNKVAQAWDDLNERQQAYLRAIYMADQETEHYRKSEGARGNWDNTPAAVWRWQLYATLAPGGDTTVKRLIRAAKLIDEGTGSTFKALEKRGLVELKYTSEGTTWEKLIGKFEDWTVFVKLTTAGRAAARAGDPAYKPTKTLPPGTLKERQWEALEAAYKAGDQGLKSDSSFTYGGFSWQYTWLRLRDYKPLPLVQEKVIEERQSDLVPGRVLRESCIVITDFGRQYYELNRERYTALYP